MSEMTREQAYRRWKKGEDPHKLAKEMGVTRERMRYILKKMDASVPLVDRIEELEAELLEAQDRANAFATKEYYTEMRAERAEAKLAKVVKAADAMAVAIEGQIDIYDASEDEVVALHNYCTTLAELKGQDQ